MKTVSKWLLSFMLALMAAGAGASGAYTNGKEYHTLGSPQPTSNPARIEVIELFWYGCPHCYHLEPYLRDWQKTLPEDVNFVRIPAILGNSWELLAKAYYTAELLGVLDKVHDELFSEIHERNNHIKDEKMLRDFFVSQGVLPESFDKTFNSFAVTVKVNNARMMTRRYAISGVPTLIVNGKYSTSAGDAGGNEQLIKVLNYLIDKERKQMATAPAAPKAAH
jgi:protein dithiol oxidoreductase (disulfide-forming)